MPKQTYPSYDAICGWNDMLPKRKARPSLEQDISVDFAVIGAGFTGLAAARRLHELDDQASIAIFEASEVGEGSSGRNSGFTSSEVLPRNATAESAVAAMRQTVLMRAALDWLIGLVAGHGIQCELEKPGAIRAAATQAGEAALRNVLEVARINGIQHEALSREDILDRAGTGYYRFGLYIKDTYLLQPAALVRGLADALPSQLTLYESTPVQRLERQQNKWILHTPAGLVRAHTVILANNGFIPKLGFLKSRMATIYTYAAITNPLTPSEQSNLGGSPAWGLLPPHRLGTTSRRIGQDRIMVRSLYAHEKGIEHSEAAAKLHDRFARRWPNLSHVDFEYVWSGATALTMNGSPCWGKLDDGLYASGGCNGSGIAKGTMLGFHLADLIMDIGDAHTVPSVMGNASFMAPEPFRSLGFTLISAIESRKAGLEM
ncbi:FAD-dependent oxidoreductase [Marivita sp. XM-24bin2]|jgi:glycine/D-amino acid oxidase-like deaminating enzyme|uniref:NAD(P)/FAD-dependent oxidoreductase n=1 Tax=unclassified Marivita TaxID=2632480 RepID=UPI000D7936AE|nr:FAD-dependent oxidoreductase [Marivita sp. XM-24bin2]MCR9110855.1 FAD-binding oxidoreductase [Paracoccaceae bacterium]PWL35168.1 MAG: FAD-dependent oxidoreductase [Marivita sp. XM-24bin2]